MKIIGMIKGSLLSLSILFSAACSHTENNNVAINKKSDLNYIQRLKILEKDYTKYKLNRSLQLFSKGYKYLDIGDIDRSKIIFIDLKNSKEKEAKEYGEYGLLLLAYETDNMFHMQRSIKNIENLDKKSEWLRRELRNYIIIYNFKIANFNKVEALMKNINESEFRNDATLTSIKAEMFVRKNKMKKAEKILIDLSNENEDSIAMNSRLIYLNKGIEPTVEYLLKKIEKYPDSDELQLLYNQYLIYSEKEKAIKNSYQLGLKTKNSYILASSIQLMFSGANNDKTLEEINMLNEKLNNLNVAKNYIDYYLVGIYIPTSDKEKENNMAIAKDFNPMNYTLLLQEYYYDSNKEERIDTLKKLEIIDPYDNYTLLELANYYRVNSMNKELSEVRNRFFNSKRIKTKEEINFMKSI